jgi:branched-chain amino acid transport system permease protein
MNRLRRGGAAIAVVLLGAFPLYASPYATGQVAMVAVFAVALLGINLVGGYAGQISFGQSAFIGLGAYTGAVTAAAGWPAVLGFLLACLLPAAVAMLLAIPAVRLHGHALAMLTLALPLTLAPLARRLEGLTGGSQGLTTAAVTPPAWTGLAADQWLYYVVLVVAAALFVLARNVLRGRVGRALAVLRSNEVVATAMGVPVRRYKIIAFTAAGAYGGAAGFLYVLCVGFVSPELLGFLLGITLLCSLVVGGMATLTGSVLGALFYVYVPVATGAVSPERSALVYGACLLAVLFLAPRGLTGAGVSLLRRLRPSVSRPLPIPPAASPEPPRDTAVAGPTGRTTRR